MSDIVLISGSPSVYSRSEKILDYVGLLLEKVHYTVGKISVSDISAEDLLYANYRSKEIEAVTAKIANAKAVVIISPVYKTAYTGILKSLLDLLPQDIFKQKAVLPLMTGGSPGHLLALEYTLKPIISVLKGQSLHGVYITDDQIDKEQSPVIIDEEILNRIHKQVNTLVEAIENNSISILQ